MFFLSAAYSWQMPRISRMYATKPQAHKYFRSFSLISQLHLIKQTGVSTMAHHWVSAVPWSDITLLMKRTQCSTWLNSKCNICAYACGHLLLDIRGIASMQLRLFRHTWQSKHRRFLNNDTEHCYQMTAQIHSTNMDHQWINAFLSCMLH